MKPSIIARMERLAKKERDLCNPFVEQICNDLRDSNIHVDEGLQSMAYFYVKNITKAISLVGDKYPIFFDKMRNITDREEYYHHTMQDALGNGLYNEKVLFCCLLKDIYSGEVPWSKVKEGGVVLDNFKEIILSLKSDGKESACKKASEFGLPDGKALWINPNIIEDESITKSMKCDTLILSEISPEDLNKFTEILRSNLDIIVEHTSSQVLDLTQSAKLTESLNRGNEQRPWLERVRRSGEGTKSVSVKFSDTGITA